MVDGEECRINGISDDGRHLLVLGFESAHADVAPAMVRAKELVQDHGGLVDESGHAEGAVGRWRTAFIRMPYFREVITPWAVLNDTFETCITWDRFPDFHRNVMAATRAAIREATGQRRHRHLPLHPCLSGRAGALFHPALQEPTGRA